MNVQSKPSKLIKGATGDWEVVIGMEVHVEMKTESKMFCACRNGLGLEKEPNVHICPVCTGQPGALPTPNRKAIESVQRAGLALGCTLRLSTGTASRLPIPPSPNRVTRA